MPICRFIVATNSLTHARMHAHNRSHFAIFACIERASSTHAWPVFGYVAGIFESVLSKRTLTVNSTWNGFGCTICIGAGQKVVLCDGAKSMHIHNMACNLIKNRMRGCDRSRHAQAHHHRWQRMQIPAKMRMLAHQCATACACGCVSLTMWQHSMKHVNVMCYSMQCMQIQKDWITLYC